MCGTIRDTFVQNDTFALDDTIKDETLRSKSRGSSQPMVNSVVDVDLHVDLHEQDLHAAAESPPEFNETLFDESSSFEETVSLTQRLNENDSFEAALVDDEDVYRNMELKLVLAKAYIENGFVEEARALLQDISGRGHEEQQRRAMRLLREVNGGVTKRAS